MLSGCALTVEFRGARRASPCNDLLGIGQEGTVVNWKNYQYNKEGVACLITLRTEWRGCAVKPEALALNGTTINLTPLWLMGGDDIYPGEWALGVLGDYTNERLNGLGWIASGDVQPNG